MDINIKALAKQIAIELKKRDAFVMSATDIALFFGFAPTSTSLRRLLADSTFPQPTSLTPNGFRCWKRDDVIAWANRKFEARGRAALETYRRRA